MRCVLLLMLLIALAGTSAQAAGTWQQQYRDALTGSVKLKRGVALCDLTMNGTPELIVVSTASNGNVSMKVYTADDGKMANMQFSGGVFYVRNVKSIAMQLRRDSSKKASLYVIVSGSNGAQRMALKHNSGKELTTMYDAHTLKASGKTKYYVGTTNVTKTKYDTARRTYENANARVANVPVSAITAKNSASAVNTKFTALRKKYNTYGPARSLSLSKSSATVKVGTTLSLTCKPTPAAAFTDYIHWVSDNEKVATVTQTGKVTAVAKGKANIIVRSGSGKYKTCKITVPSPVPVNVKISATDISLTQGKLKQLTATVSPTSADGSVKWSSSKTSVAKVDQAGNVVANSKGTATITAKTSNGLTAKCTVVVSRSSAVIVDISQHSYSAGMNWELIADSVDLLILRCGVTRTFTDPIGVGKDDKFAYFAKMCKQYNIPFGVYFYGKCSDEETAKQEAQMTWDIASPYNPLFYVYDVEETCLNKVLIETYMKTLKKLGAKKTGYYIAHHLYQTYKLDTSLVDFIWLPRYGKNNGSIDATPAYKCDLHQYTSVGRLPGFECNLDMNRLTGEKDLSWFLSRK